MIRKIRVDTNGSALTRRWKIYLDDKDISEFITGIRISGDIHSATQVVLYCVAELEFPNDILANVVISDSSEEFVSD